MKTKKNLRCKPLSIKSKFFLFYTAAFLLCAAGVYACFIIKGCSLVVSGDGWKQHFTAFVYFGQYGRTVLRTLLTEHSLVLPQWSFSLGFGGDILTTLHYYVIGDPLDLLSIACPTRYAIYLYSVLSLLRLYLAGLGFGAFCMFKKQLAPLPLAVGGVCYVFFTYSFLMVARHPFFALPMVYLPLLLLGVEHVLAKRRPYLFIFTVFLAAISNFYFFYMLALITAFYTAFRLFCLYNRHSAKQAFAGLFQIAMWAVLGVIMSAAILLPVSIAFLGDTRNAGYQFNWFYNANFYKNFLSTYFTSTSGLGNQTFLGFNAIAFPAIYLLFFQRKDEEKPLRILFILSTALLLLPAFGWLLNGLTYAANRWIWAYSLLVAYIVTTQWKKLRHITIGQAVGCVCALAVYSLFAIPPMTLDTRNIGVSILLAFLILAVCAFAPKFKKKYVATALVLVLVLTSFTGNATYFYSSHGGNYITNFVTYKEAPQKLKNTAAKKVKKAAKGDTDFYRYSGNRLVYNTDLLAKTHSTSFYWSIQNPNIAQFVDETELPARENYMYKDLNDSAALQALAGVKYYVQKDQEKLQAPYGFTPYTKNVFKSRNALPIGYTYDSAILRKDYEKLPALEKQQAQLQGVVLNSIPTNIAETDLHFTDTSLPYTITGDKNAAIEGKKIHIYKKGSTVTLHFSGAPNSETYLRMGLKNYVDYPAYTYYMTQENDPLHRYSHEKWKKKSSIKKTLCKQDARKFKQETLLKFQYGYQTEKEKVGNCRSLAFASAYALRFDNYKTYTVNTGYSKEAKTDITLTFDACGIYDFSTLEVLEQPMTSIDSQVAKLATDTLQKVQIGTDTIDGTISLKEAKVLLLTIPYSEGWTATVDGNPAELLQANTMFSALALEPGEHTIHLSYRTPHLRTGAYLSAVGAVAFAAVIICTECQIKKKKSAGTD